jgi:peptidoglycan hydrolase-like protein with peptidoglycan-binding domain
MKRRRTAAVFVVIVVIAAAVGWVLGSRTTSPAEIAARTAAPQPSPIVVPAEVRVLSTDVITRGTGRFGAGRDVVLPPSWLKGDPGVVTRLPEPAQHVGDGEVLLVVSGRPVILLEGDSPNYRDLGPGMSGADVQQLEAALDRLGHEPGSVDGIFDASTEAAVRRLYESHGSTPATATEDLLTELASSQLALFGGSTPGPGILVPADEIVFLPGLPVRVTEIVAELGQTPDGAVLTVANSAVAIDGSVPIEQSGLIEVGMSVRIDEPDLGIEATGFVSELATGPGTNDLDGFHVYFAVAVDDAPANLVNASVRLTIPIESTSEAVLAVPTTALRLTPDGTSEVQVQRDGTFESVAVRPGLSAQGFAEVTPLDGQLAEGDLVLVGFDQAVVPETTVAG